MSKVEDFLTANEEQEIITAIRQAEKDTSGEIRVHLEKTTSKEHYIRAQEVFFTLKMYNTQQRNAVLIYVAVEDKKFVIFGDEGINKIVSDSFWDTTKDKIQKQFLVGEFKKGIVEGVLSAGFELKKHFPWTIEDTNELSNEISKS